MNPETYTETIHRFRLMRRERLDAATAASLRLNGVAVNPDNSLNTLVASYDSIREVKAERDRMNEIAEKVGAEGRYWVAIGQTETVQRRVSCLF